MGSLYRMGLPRSRARLVTDWRKTSIPKVIALLAVEQDGLKTLTIGDFGTSLGAQVDPAGKLKF